MLPVDTWEVQPVKSNDNESFQAIVPPVKAIQARSVELEKYLNILAGLRVGLKTHSMGDSADNRCHSTYKQYGGQNLLK